MSRYLSLTLSPIDFMILVAVFLLPMQLSACSPQFQGHHRTTTETLSAKCKVAETPSVIQAVDNTIIITAGVVTPTPCYEIKGSVKIEGTEIVVRLEPESRGEVCVQCIGEIVGKVTIPDLPRGIYSVTLQTPESASITTIRIGK